MTAKFDVVLTGDSNIKHQQNLRNRRIAIVVLRARDNRLKTHLSMIDRVNAAFESISSGELIEIH